MYNFLTIAILLLSVSPTYAHLHANEEQDKPYNIKSPNETAPFQAVNHKEEYYGCSGYVRAGFIQTNHFSASAIGGELGCGYQLNQYIKAHLGVFASLDPGINSHNDENIHSEFFNSKKDSYIIVGEAVLSLSFQKFEAHLGRQNFDSPHLNGDDLRMIANLFEAYLIDYHFSDKLYFGTGFVRTAAGWENGANASQFVSIGEAYGGQESGAWLSWLNFHQDSLTSDNWFYYIPDHLAILYSEFIYTYKLSDTVSYSFGLQYDWGNETGKAELGQVDTHTLGVMGAISWSDFTLTAAYNKNFGETGALASVGSGPFFTSAEDQTLDAVEVGKGQSEMLNFDYSFNELLSGGVILAKFSASNKNEYNKEELNIYINFDWKKAFAAELIYAAVDNLNSGPDQHQIRVILTYQY